MKATVAHRHATGLVRAEAEAIHPNGTGGSAGDPGMGLGWICERELREGWGGRSLHVPDGVVVSTDDGGQQWRTAVEVELTVVAILRHLLAAYDDVVYRVHPSAMTVVTRSVGALTSGAERIMIVAGGDPASGEEPNVRARCVDSPW